MIINGDARHIPLADESVYVCVTSPPYLGLRAYAGVEPVTWADGSTCCLGLEPTIELYVAHLVEVFREVRRVLRPDGTVWLNLGSSYQDKQALMVPHRVALALQADGWFVRSEIVWAKGLSFCDAYSGSVMPESVRDRPTTAHEYIFLLSKSATYYYDQEAEREANVIGSGGRQRAALLGKRAPRKGMLAGAAISGSTLDDPAHQLNPAGRNLRSVWAIGTSGFPGAHFAVFPPALVRPMINLGCPARCCPTCGRGWEREVTLGRATSTGGSATGARASNMEIVSVRGQSPASAYNTGNMVAHEHITHGFRPACDCHSALVRPMVNLGCPARCCPTCGRGWERETEIQAKTRTRLRVSLGQDSQEGRSGRAGEVLSITLGFRPACDCHSANGDTPHVPGVVLDPFAGSGTCGLVCDELGRRFVGVDASRTYCDMAVRRIDGARRGVGMIPEEQPVDMLPLFRGAL